MFNLSESSSLHIKQVRELAELLGFETKNQYVIIDQEEIEIGRAIEVSNHIGHFIMRQFLGHFRRFEVLFFDAHSNKILKAIHPFRFFFHELEIYDHNEKMIGVIKQRFSFFYKKFDIVGQHGRKLFSVKSPWFKFWTFNIERMNRKEASVIKKWAGLTDELFFDKDNFKINYFNPELDPREKNLILASAIFIDLIYFERKAN